MPSIQHTSIAAVLGLGLLLAGSPATAQVPEMTPAFEAAANAGVAHINDGSACPGVIAAPALMADLDMYTVLDIRSESAWIEGHIPGSHHTSLTTILETVTDLGLLADSPMVVVGYTGMSAGLARFALALSGYHEVRVLKWGMADWNPQFSTPWDINVGDLLAAPETENQNGNLVTHDFPALDGDPATIVAERVQAVLQAGFRSVSFMDIMDNLNDYFVINYFGVHDYEGTGMSGVPGHIPGAFQFTPHASLAPDQMLANIPTDRPVVVYDWTGLHAAQVVGYLNLLGYDAHVLRFGVNALFHSSLTAQAWTGSVNAYPVETGGMLDIPETSLSSLTCYPNPFNPMTTISYTLALDSPVSVRVHDLKGRLVADLVNRRQSAGSHQVTWDGTDTSGHRRASGIYLVQVQTRDGRQTRKLSMVQ